MGTFTSTDATPAGLLGEPAPGGVEDRERADAQPLARGEVVRWVAMLLVGVAAWLACVLGLVAIAT